MENSLPPNLRAKIEKSLAEIKAAKIKVTPAIFQHAKRAVRMVDRVKRIDHVLARIPAPSKDDALKLLAEREERSLEAKLLGMKLDRIANG